MAVVEEDIYQLVWDMERKRITSLFDTDVSQFWQWLSFGTRLLSETTDLESSNDPPDRTGRVLGVDSVLQLLYGVPTCPRLAVRTLSWRSDRNDT
jgi:hypothetical protein